MSSNSKKGPATLPKPFGSNIDSTPVELPTCPDNNINYPQIEQEMYQTRSNFGQTPSQSAMKVAKSAGQKTTADATNGSNGSKDPVQVYCRIRPLKSLTELAVVSKESSTLLKIQDSRNENFYSFSNIFSEYSAQKDVYMEIAYPLVSDLLNDKDGLLFTYGVTSSGKTYTLTGTPDQPGILPRSLDTIFASIQGSQCRKHTFKPNSQNGFTILSLVDAEKEERQRTLRYTPKTPSKRRANAIIEELRTKMRASTADVEKVDLGDNPNHFAVFVSYVEIYNKYVYDLLDDESSDRLRLAHKPESKNLREIDGKFFVQGGTELEVYSAEEAIGLFNKGFKRRRIAQTTLNVESSRSHSVFNIRLVQAPLDRNNSYIKDFMSTSQLSLVDLAGSERTDRTGATDDRVKEASNINNSLSNLRKCINILRENQRLPLGQAPKHVPYRSNTLTKLFKSYFEGHGRIRMIICVNPSADDRPETLHVMEFAEAAQDVMIKKAQSMPLYMKRELAGLSNPFDVTYPSCNFADPADDCIFPEWMETLDQRAKNRERALLSLDDRLNAFRTTLAEMEQKCMISEQELKMCLSDLAARTDQLNGHKDMISMLQQKNQEYRERANQYESQIRQLEEELRAKDLQINRHNQEIGQLKQAWQDKYDEDMSSMKKKYKRSLGMKESEINTIRYQQAEKAAQVAEILDLEPDPDLRKLHQHFSPVRAPVVDIPAAPIVSASGRTLRSRQLSTPQMPYTGGKLSTPKTPATVTTRSSVQQQKPEPAEVAANERNPPVSNPRHRQSLSSGGERWIDHKPQGTVDTGTVFKPKIKNCKSISNLANMSTEKLLNYDNYALTNNIATPDGNVETHVYKGDIIPTSLGGAQVVFNDVETLIQASPRASRKRSSSMSHTIGVPDSVANENRSPRKTISPNKRNRRY